MYGVYFKLFDPGEDTAIAFPLGTPLKTQQSQALEDIDRLRQQGRETRAFQTGANCLLRLPSNWNALQQLSAKRTSGMRLLLGTCAQAF
ncbi:MAG: hypothetical protein JO202_05950 [Ktedonobacteraceae bacterium]|nr:hypothetical protein [Ktedonobacteraceae bacterium]